MMNYYSTNGKAPVADLRKAVVKGLAEDRGLYMPERIAQLPSSFFEEIGGMSFHEVACTVADAFFGEDIDADTLHKIVCETLSFDCPVVKVDDNVWSLELFHGPTLAFKDVGARFMARMLQHYAGGKTLHVLVATSGDTGSAVANGFLGVEGVHVHVLYPKGKVSPIQECQFTTLGRNITAVEIDGSFDDCQALVKSAFMDKELNERMMLTSANSINVARFLPQSFYYFWAYAQMKKLGLADNLVFCVPSGNFGNICSALFGKRMGLPVKHFIAANNANSVFYDFLQNGEYSPRPSVRTIANAMDVGDPSNFARIYDLYSRDWKAICADISGVTYSDEQIADTIRECLTRTNYLLDPHGACAYRALRDYLGSGSAAGFAAGSVARSVAGSAAGFAAGSVAGSAASFAAGSAAGSVGGSAAGFAAGSTAGSVAGFAAGSVAGSVGGSAAGFAEGSVAGSAAGPIAGLAAESASGFAAKSAAGSTVNFAASVGANQIGVFCETAHPAKFKQTVEAIIGREVAIPDRLAAFMTGTKRSVPLPASFTDFKAYLLK